MAIQPLLFNPDLEPIQYIADNGTFELTLDGKFKTFWLSQKQIADIFNLTQSTISAHITNFKKDRPDASTYRNFRIVQREGNRDVERDIEHYNHSVVIYIGYRAQATQETIRFQRFVEEIFRQRMEDEHARAIKKVQHGRDVKKTGYILDGMSETHAQKRMDTVDTFNQLRGIIAQISNVKMIGRVVGREYMLLFGKLADELKRILNTKSVRDGLPELQLSYIKLAEETLVMVLSRKDHLTDEELIDIVDKTVRPLGEHLHMICQSMGIDTVTGRPLLNAGGAK
jgi:hypothetical protein